MYSSFIAYLNAIVRNNGAREITGNGLNSVLRRLFDNAVGRPRVVAPGETHVIAAATEQHWAQNLYVKGTLRLDTQPPSDYGEGLAVSRDAICRVDGLLVNEGLIINNGLIIN